MTFIPTTPEEFYRLRDDRTNRCLERSVHFHEADCLVSIDPALLETYTGQVMLLVSCNLLSRWCRRVTVVIPTAPSHPLLDSKFGQLSETILSQMYQADPFGRFAVEAQLVEGMSIQLHIGSDLTAAASQRTVISASGWYAAIFDSGFIRCEDKGQNVIGAVAAACLGVAQVFKYALGHTDRLIGSGIFDLLRLRRLDDPQSIQHRELTDLNLGSLLMVGAGSVGSSAAYCLKLLHANCRVTIIDKDVVKIENLSRSPLFGVHSVGMNKAEVVGADIRSARISVDIFPGWWSEFIEERGREKNGFDLWLPLANEFDVRWSMQNNFPPLMVHASTTRNWGVNHGRHIPGRDDCLADRFPGTAEPSALQCSEGEIRLPTISVDAALPFLSAFAGVLIAAELARLSLPDYPQAQNFSLFDFFGNMQHVQTWDRTARAGCLCRSQRRELSEVLNGQTKYFNLFHQTS